MTDTPGLQPEIDAERRELNRGVAGLKVARAVRFAGLPILAVSAVASVAVGPVVFAAVAVAVGAAEFIADRYAKQEKARVDNLLKHLEDRDVVKLGEAAQISSVANSAAVGR